MKKFENGTDVTVDAVLANVEEAIDNYFGPEPIRRVYDNFSIFDWWPEKLNMSHLKQMRTFLKTAKELGYTGYCCFKVGASGCANGMWAHKELSKDGYSPDGACLYRSFSPDYTYWQVTNDNGEWGPAGDAEYDSLKTKKDLLAYLNK